MYNNTLLRAHSERVRFYSEKYYRPMPESSAGEDDTMIDTRRLIVHRCRPLCKSNLYCRVMSNNKSYPQYIPKHIRIINIVPWPRKSVVATRCV